MKGSDQRSHPSEADQDPGTAAEPRWPALVAALAVAGIYGALPPSLSAGPRWLALVITAVLLVLLNREFFIVVACPDTVLGCIYLTITGGFPFFDCGDLIFRYLLSP